MNNVPEVWAGSVKDKAHLYFRCAFSILRDECPPDNKFYLCAKGEDPEHDCVNCWDNYLWFLENGLNPYKQHLKEED